MAIIPLDVQEKMLREQGLNYLADLISPKKGKVIIRDIPTLKGEQKMKTFKTNVYQAIILKEREGSELPSIQVVKGHILASSASEARQKAIIRAGILEDELEQIEVRVLAYEAR